MKVRCQACIGTPGLNMSQLAAIDCKHCNGTAFVEKQIKMRIAVIGKGFFETLDWLRGWINDNSDAVSTVEVAAQRVITKGGKEFKIILDKGDLNGQEFHGFITCPTYDDLVALTKKQCRF